MNRKTMDQINIYKYLNNPNNKTDPTDIYKKLNSKATLCPFLSAQEIFIKVDNILCNVTSFNKFLRIEIKQDMFCSHSEIKLHVNNRKITRNSKIFIN